MCFKYLVTASEYRTLSVTYSSTHLRYAKPTKPLFTLFVRIPHCFFSVGWKSSAASSNSVMAARWDEVEGPLRGKVGQASVGTAVAQSHYCFSAASEEKGRSRHMATLPLCHACPPSPATHTQGGLVVPGGTTRSLHSCHVWQGGRAKRRGVAG